MAGKHRAMAVAVGVILSGDIVNRGNQRGNHVADMTANAQEPVIQAGVSRARPAEEQAISDLHEEKDIQATP